MVSTDRGGPLQHALVEVVDGSASSHSDARGGFELPVDPPVELRITHPRFQTSTVKVAPGATAPLEVILVAKQEVYERIAVSATRGESTFRPVTVSTVVAEPDDAQAPPATVTEMVSETSSVSENGQGGLFQTYSVRGVSRQRVMTLISGMRLVSERRAGVSASFLDPRLPRFRRHRTGAVLDLLRLRRPGRCGSTLPPRLRRFRRRGRLSIPGRPELPAVRLGRRRLVPGSGPSRRRRCRGRRRDPAQLGLQAGVGRRGACLVRSGLALRGAGDRLPRPRYRQAERRLSRADHDLPGGRASPGALRRPLGQRLARQRVDPSQPAGDTGRGSDRGQPARQRGLRSRGQRTEGLDGRQADRAAVRRGLLRPPRSQRGGDRAARDGRRPRADADGRSTMRKRTSSVCTGPPSGSWPGSWRWRELDSRRSGRATPTGRASTTAA